LTFENCIRGTVIRDENSLHAGAPVEGGEKWIATLWFRELPARATRFRSTQLTNVE
jgi:prolyl 4-hydroxylase